MLINIGIFSVTHFLFPRSVSYISFNFILFLLCILCLYLDYVQLYLLIFFTLLKILFTSPITSRKLVTPSTTLRTLETSCPMLIRWLPNRHLLGSLDTRCICFWNREMLDNFSIWCGYFRKCIQYFM